MQLRGERDTHTHTQKDKREAFVDVFKEQEMFRWTQRWLGLPTCAPPHPPSLSLGLWVRSGVGVIQAEVTAGSEVFSLLPMLLAAEPHVSLSLSLSAPLVLQTDMQGVHRPAGSGPISPGELEAQPHPGARHPELLDPLQPHLPRLWQPGGVRRGHGPAELSHRGPQGHGQNVPQQQPEQPHGQQRQKQ